MGGVFVSVDGVFVSVCMCACMSEYVFMCL